MLAPLSDAALDAILALQFTVAWDGEGRCSPSRLGWWDTDLIDDAGDGDLLARLRPQTASSAPLCSPPRSRSASPSIRSGRRLAARDVEQFA